MNLPAQLLTQGPRGRRMLLEFAVRGEALASGDVTTELPLWKALFDHRVAHGPEVRVQGWGAEHVPRSTNPEELARLLSRVPLVRARPSLLLDALQRSAARERVGGDDVDLLLSSWRLDPALSRVAEQVTSTGKVGWWGRPVKRDAQRLLEQPGRRRGRREDRPSSRPRQRPLTSRPWPRRGPVAAVLTGSAEAGSRVAVPRKARILEMSSADDWAALCRRFGRRVAAREAESWQRLVGGRSDVVLPDWKKVAKHHDAVHLTVLGWLAASGTVVDVAEGACSIITGWPPDATVWLTGLPR